MRKLLGLVADCVWLGLGILDLSRLLSLLYGRVKLFIRSCGSTFVVWMHLWSCKTRYGRVRLALVVDCLYLYACMLPIRLCDSTLTIVVPSGSLIVADKHNWSREVTCGRLDYSMVTPSLLYDRLVPPGLLDNRSGPSWTAVWSPTSSVVAHSASTFPLDVSTFLLGSQLVVEISLWSPTIVFLHGEPL